MAGYGLDTIYRSTLMNPIIPKIFANGLGNPALIERLVTNFHSFRDPDFIRHFLIGKYGRYHPVRINRRAMSSDGKHRCLEGSFQSPFNELVPNSMPQETRTAHFTMLLPSKAGARCPMVIQLAGTGDYSVSLHAKYAKRLLDHGVGSLLLVNPFYKPRRPAAQKSSSLLHLSDLFVMGGALILECWLLLRWLESRGYGPLALHGISMGGYMASLAASVYNRPILLVPCLSWTTSSSCYVRGVLSNSMSWDVIRRQLAEETAFKERIWPIIKDACCPPMYRVPPDYRDPLQPEEAVKPDADGAGSLESLRAAYARLYDSLPSIGLGVGLFAAGERLSETATSATSAMRQTQLMNAMENRYRRAEAAAHSRGDPHLEAEDEEMREFVTCLLDFFTHLGNFEAPVDTTMVYSLQALSDAYVPRDGVYPLTELWPGMKCRTVSGGHVSTIFNNCFWSWRPHDMRNLVLEALDVKI